MNQSELTDLFAARPQSFAWFIGAGASRMSGLPTATDIIWDLKRRYYCREENQDISRQDMQSAAVATRIQQFMDARGFPPLWADSEYTTFFEKIFGEDRVRQRDYLRGILAEDKVTLTVGNRILAALMAAGLCRMAFTTNFDSVVERAFAEVSGKSISAYHLEGSAAANQALANEEYPIYCKLHGDFRYDSIKNLASDLAKQDKALAESMLTAASRFGFIVAGYSGRDESIMELFRKALARPDPFPHGVLWTGIRGAPIYPAVTEFIAAAEAVGVRAAYVEIDTFDALMLRLWRNLANRPSDLDAKVRKALPASVNITIPKPGTGAPLLRLNALPVARLPERALAIRMHEEIDWKTLRAIQADADDRIIVTKGAEILCWGNRAVIAKAFGDKSSSIEGVDLSDALSSGDPLAIKGFAEEALATAFARQKPLLARRRALSPILIADAHADDIGALQPLVSELGKLTGQVAGVFAPIDDEHPVPQKVFWAEAVRISLAQKNGSCWAVIDPDIWIWPPRARDAAREFLDERRKDRLNIKFNRILGAWVQVLTGTSDRAATVNLFAFDDHDDDANPHFTLSTRTAFTSRHVG
ncbi:MAG TPA: SIR2 family protein [Sphingopyxis sp.]|uniref:SIR2 family protein n=1 Tax=Sphingopyxis sp. TaxID=1908224 RepID=UPI002C68473A|nr:SIR2 family protein [Sphingopyxis sp.]HWW58156.1 SIR2 family protein [Sphingopyxis sp.]